MMFVIDSEPGERWYWTILGDDGVELCRSSDYYPSRSKATIVVGNVRKQAFYAGIEVRGGEVNGTPVHRDRSWTNAR